MGSLGVLTQEIVKKLICSKKRSEHVDFSDNGGDEIDGLEGDPIEDFEDEDNGEVMDERPGS